MYIIRYVNPIRVVKRLEVKQPEYVAGLKFALHNYDGEALFSNEYIKKWMRIECTFRAYGIQLEPNDYPKGLAINLGLIKLYFEHGVDVIEKWGR